MDAFEQIVAGLFRARGYWTINGYRVELTREDKQEIGKTSLPRPELDILAYKGAENRIVWIECKSYIDSGGVRYASFTDPIDPGYSRFKMFNDETYRKVISKALIKQVVESGLTKPDPKLEYCLVTGHTYSDKEREKIKQHFDNNGWVFNDEVWVNKELHDYAKHAYEDDIVMIASKIIIRSMEKMNGVEK